MKIFEQTYFAITCWGAVAAIAAGAISGYFTGQGKTRVVMIVQLTGFALNAILDYLLIFGRFGFPRWGMGGAAIATVSAQAVVTLILFFLFLSSKPHGSPWKNRAFEGEMFSRLLKFGIPNGLRFAFEMLAWTVFVCFVGRIGSNELAATNIAFRINGFAFFPIVGLGQALGILVGQAQGNADPQRTIKLTYTGLFIAELWMITLAAIFVFFPSQLFGLFAPDDPLSRFQAVSDIGVVLLRFVAIYSLLDAGNIVFVSSLQSAGDTRWTMILSIIAHSVFLAVLGTADMLKLGLWFEWTVATVFVMTVAFAWWLRFHSGKWKNIRVIEPNMDKIPESRNASGVASLTLEIS